jgi:hypothetical protein
MDIVVLGIDPSATTISQLSTQLVRRRCLSLNAT